MKKKTTQNNINPAIAVLIGIIVGVAVTVPFMHSDFEHGIAVGSIFTSALVCGILASTYSNSKK
ncbi:MAG TPA: hypothetical protein VLG47_01185 [Candidatus Saccharimonadales bacterium]|nr:hypothetical protein [Candidatus Saccharimonadales bacterium]